MLYVSTSTIAPLMLSHTFHKYKNQTEIDLSYIRAIHQIECIFIYFSRFVYVVRRLHLCWMNDRETESASLTLTGGIVSPSLTHHFAVEISGESVCICKIVHNLVKYFSCIFSFPFNLRDGKKKVERATVAWWRWRWTSHTGDSGMNEKQKIAYMQMFRTRAITLIQLYEILYVLDVFVLVWESECVCKMAEVLLIPRIIYLRNYSTEAEDGRFFMKKVS